MHKHFSFYIYIIPHWIFLQVSVRKGPSSGNQNKVIQNETKLTIFAFSWRYVKETNDRSLDICLHSSCINVMDRDMQYVGSNLRA